MSLTRLLASLKNAQSYIRSEPVLVSWFLAMGMYFSTKLGLGLDADFWLLLFTGSSAYYSRRKTNPVHPKPSNTPSPYQVD